MRSMRRKGSAAPQSSWSPTVKAEMYCGPICSFRIRPIGVSIVPVTAAGDSLAIEGHGAFGEILEAGDKKNLTLNLPPGHYVLYCNLEGHYLGSMHATLDVH